MTLLRILGLVVAGLFALGAIGLFLSIVTFRVGWSRDDDGPPEPPPGDVPNIPSGLRPK